MLARTPTAKTWTRTETMLQIEGMIFETIEHNNWNLLAVAQWVSGQ